VKPLVAPFLPSYPQTLAPKLAQGPHALAVYLHWPWCKKKCPYCDFNSHVVPVSERLETAAQAYGAAVLRELTHWQRWLAEEAAQQGGPHAIVSVFMGGGTPSLMPVPMVAAWVAAAKALGHAAADCEVTVECNPTSLTERDARDYFRQLKAVGVNRVSIGVQALQDDLLSFLGREHNVRQARATLDAALAEMPRVSVDVMYGLPEQTPDAWARDLTLLAGLGLRHISAYQLTIEPHTHFAAAVRQGHWQPVDQDTEADFFELTQHVLGDAGLCAYEISNFAAPDEACRHNLHVWRYGAYVGAGAGAHGRVALGDAWLATQGLRAPEPYQQMWRDWPTEPPKEAWVRWERLSPTEAAQEAIMMGLRLKAGINLSCQNKHVHTGFHAAVDWAGVTLCKRMGWLRVEGPTWQLTDKGWPRLNGVLGQVLKGRQGL